MTPLWQLLKQQGQSQSKGRGGLVTYLSKTTINMLIKIMKNMIQERISYEVSQEQYYSILDDSAQDISSIVIWYVLKGITCEQLLSVVPILMVQNNRMMCACISYSICSRI